MSSSELPAEAKAADRYDVAVLFGRAVAFLAFACGLILDTVTRGRREAKLIAYLALRAPGEERRRS